MAEKEYTPNILNGRTVGEVLPLSIGTALAIEILSQDEKVCNGYEALYINLHTVLRNLMAAFTEAPTRTEMGNVITCFIEEYETILEVVKSHLPKSWIIILYYPTYKSLAGTFKYAKLKSPQTAIQKTYALIEHESFKTLFKKYPDIPKGDCRIPGNNLKALILTHLPIDLLSVGSFRKLALLESHTGVIKEYPQWITKLNNKGNVNLPFNSLTLTILGDRKMFGSMGNPFTKHLFDLAEKGKWTALTTRARIKFDIATLRNKADVKILNDILMATPK